MDAFFRASLLARETAGWPRRGPRSSLFSARKQSVDVSQVSRCLFNNQFDAPMGVVARRWNIFQRKKPPRCAPAFFSPSREEERERERELSRASTLAAEIYRREAAQLEQLRTDRSASFLLDLPPRRASPWLWVKNRHGCAMEFFPTGKPGSWKRELILI